MFTLSSSKGQRSISLPLSVNEPLSTLDVNFEKRQGDLSTLGNEDHGRRLGLLCVVQMVGNHSSSQPVNRKWTRTAGVVCVRIQVGPSVLALRRVVQGSDISD